jgi:small GTP-binding protein
MSWFRKLFKSRTKQVNITICGLDKAGKTTIVRYLVSGEHKETVPTMGVNREVIDLPKLQMDVFDLGGQEDFRGMWPEVNEKSDGLIYVIDSADKFRLMQNKEVFYNIINTQIDQLIPVMMLLNKQDLADKIERSEFISTFELGKLENINWTVFETSALTGQGLYEAFKWFIDNFQE